MNEKEKENLEKVVDILTPTTDNLNYNESKIKSTNILKFSQEVMSNLESNKNIKDYYLSATYNNIIENNLDIELNLKEYFKGSVKDFNNTIDESDIRKIFETIKPSINQLNLIEIDNLGIKVNFNIEKMTTLPYRYMKIDLTKTGMNLNDNDKDDFYECFSLRGNEIEVYELE